jgi:hypothetical protein
MKYRFFIISGIILLGFNELFISDVFAYIDPGSGSLVIQIIVGALVGAGITIKIYWYKLKEKFIRTSKKND